MLYGNSWVVHDSCIMVSMFDLLHLGCGISSLATGFTFQSNELTVCDRHIFDAKSYSSKLSCWPVSLLEKPTNAWRSYN
jgi:hypothetical protein